MITLEEIQKIDPKAKFIRENDSLIGLQQNKGKLTMEMVYYRGDNRGKYYYCKCDCGKYTTVWGNHFRSEHTKSCGCYASELGKEKMKAIIKRKQDDGSLYKDLTNKTHGWILALEPTEERHNDLVVWKCKCLLCNNIFTRDTTEFERSVSCGCLNVSEGVKKIEILLNNYNIPFVKEKRFETCKDTLPLPFDFYVNNQYLIEFDGEQHFKDINLWGGKDKLENRQKHDNIKNNWCKKNNIPLIRIPYTKVDSLCLEDIVPETSNFIIKL